VGWFEPPSRLSPSAQDTFDQCPQRWKFGRLDHLTEESTVAQVKGSFVHDVLDRLLGRPPEQRTLETAKAIAKELWAETWEKEWAETEDRDRDPNDFRWKSWWVIESYFKMEDPAKIHPAGREAEYLGSIGAVPMKGIIDRWERTDGGAIIADYKTGKVPRPLYADKPMKQMLIYGDLIEQAHGITVERADLLYVTFGQVVQITPTKQNVAEMRSSVAETWDKLNVACETGVFKPIPGRLCDWCSFKPVCPAWTTE
jgi:putative RecB family exonuclease